MAFGIDSQAGGFYSRRVPIVGSRLSHFQTAKFLVEPS